MKSYEVDFVIILILQVDQLKQRSNWPKALLGHDSDSTVYTEVATLFTTILHSVTPHVRGPVCDVPPTGPRSRHLTQAEPIRLSLPAV